MGLFEYYFHSKLCQLEAWHGMPGSVYPCAKGNAGRLLIECTEVAVDKIMSVQIMFSPLVTSVWVVREWITVLLSRWRLNYYSLKYRERVHLGQDTIELTHAAFTVNVVSMNVGTLPLKQLNVFICIVVMCSV